MIVQSLKPVFVAVARVVPPFLSRTGMVNQVEVDGFLEVVVVFLFREATVLCDEAGT